MVRFATRSPASFLILMTAGLMIAACATTGATGSDGGTKAQADDPAVAAASSLETFEAVDISGVPFDLEDYLGRDVIVLSFWATFCEPCKTEMPTLQRMHDAYGKDGLKIVSIALDGPDTMAGVVPYIRSNRYTFPVIIDEDTSIAGSYNTKAAMPFMVIIDRKGTIHKTIEGFQLSEAAHLEAEIAALVAAK